MTTTWADIQRLAADLQRVQLSEGAKKLSEKNCIEVVSMLIASKAIDIVFTSDGNAYLTRKHLITEIKNECIGRGGRVSLSDLAQTLVVDYEHVENSVLSIVKQSTSFVLCNAELISRDYIDSLCKELNERLAETGALSVSQLAKNWDLPSEILYTLVLTEIGNKIDAMREGDTIYTRAYVHSQLNYIRAILNSLTKVTPVSKLSAQLNLSPSLFWSLYDELAAANEIPGTVIGNRSSNLAYYVPNLHSMLVKSFVLKSFEQNQSIETSVLKKLSITDAKVYLKEILAKAVFSSLIFFPSAVISKKLWDEFIAAVKEEMEKQYYCDVGAHMPASLSSDQDTEMVISMCMKSSKEWRIAPGLSYIYASQLPANALKAIDGFINEKAEKEAVTWGKQQKTNRKEEKPAQDDDWTAGKGGKKGKGGRGKANKGAAKEEALSASSASVHLSAEELKSELERQMTIPGELLDEIIEQIAQYADGILKERIETLVRTVQTISAQDQKRSFVQLQEKIKILYYNVCVFDQATNSFDDAVATDLRSYLLRTLCTDIANIVLSFMSGTENTNTLSVKIRDETIANIENTSSREAVIALYSAISDVDLNAFHDAIMQVSSPAVCSLNIKMPDKKHRAELVEQYASELERQLNECEDAASGLLIALLLILARRYAIAVHASGKFVSHLIDKVEKVADLGAEHNELLRTMQKLVISSMKNKSDMDVKAKLNERLKELKVFLLGSAAIELQSSKEDDMQTSKDDGELIELKS